MFRTCTVSSEAPSACSEHNNAGMAMRRIIANAQLLECAEAAALRGGAPLESAKPLGAAVGRPFHAGFVTPVPLAPTISAVSATGVVRPALPALGSAAQFGRPFHAASAPLATSAADEESGREPMVESSVRCGVATVTLNRPNRLNCLSKQASPPPTLRCADTKMPISFAADDVGWSVPACRPRECSAASRVL